MSDNSNVDCSVTRFGKIMLFRQYFRSLRQLCEDLFSVGQKFEPALVNILCHWANFIVANGLQLTINLAIWSHCFSSPNEWSKKTTTAMCVQVRELALPSHPRRLLRNFASSGISSSHPYAKRKNQTHWLLPVETFFLSTHVLRHDQLGWLLGWLADSVTR